MISFRGILNDNGLEKTFSISLNPYAKESYQTNFFLNNIIFDAEINDDICTVNGTNYRFKFKQIPSEILIIGKEELHWTYFYFCMPFLGRPKFFLATNKEEV